MKNKVAECCGYYTTFAANFAIAVFRLEVWRCRKRNRDGAKWIFSSAILCLYFLSEKDGICLNGRMKVCVQTNLYSALACPVLLL